MEEALREWQCFDSSWYDSFVKLFSVGDSWLVVVDMRHGSAAVHQFIPWASRWKGNVKYMTINSISIKGE